MLAKPIIAHHGDIIYDRREESDHHDRLLEASQAVHPLFIPKLWSEENWREFFTVTKVYLADPQYSLGVNGSPEESTSNTKASNRLDTALVRNCREMPWQCS